MTTNNYNTYFCRRNAKFNNAAGNEVTVKYGEIVNAVGRNLIRDNQLLCTNSSQNCIFNFVQNDDGNGEYRGKLITNIMTLLVNPFIPTCPLDPRYDDEVFEKAREVKQKRWDKIWEDELCQKYKRPDHEDFWLWHTNFYNAPIKDLEYILELIKD